jgi:hypothetical protein
MKLRFSFVAALAASLAATSTAQWVHAQSRSTSVYNNGARPASQTAAAAETLPGHSMMSGHQSMVPANSAPAEASANGYSQGGYVEGYPSDGYCDSGYCSDCDDGGYGFCNLLGKGNGQFFVTADYLNVHASFSEATAYVDQDLANGSDQFIPLQFDYNSSFRVGGGWRSCCCGDQIRFMYTQMTSNASDTAFFGDIVPYEASPPPGGQTNISANVDARTMDIECAKTIPLGGQCCDCGDGCCDSCGPCCPAWDITWSGGVRWADVGWQRSYVASDSTAFPVTDAQIGMNFRGGGLRTGLEGRRYFFKDGWLSIYGKGDISLLLGDVNVSSIRSVDDPTTGADPDIVNTQTFRTRQIVPVTELEAGLTAQVSRSTAITAGYLFAAYHDLGFRDEHELNTLLPTTYDDANILGFDGFFARIEMGF